MPTDSSEGQSTTPFTVRVWSTKGIDFWSLLSAILIKAQPDSILELGGGRSTTFLADYGARYRKRSVTFEQSEEWHRKIHADLGAMGLTSKHVHHLPLDQTLTPPWYDLARARALLGSRAFDFVFVDGPQGGGRRNVEGQKLIVHAARAARLIVVDDTHRPYNLELFNQLAERFPPDGHFHYRYRNNWLAIGAGEWAPLVQECFGFLGMSFQRTPAPTSEAKGPADD